jgi:hypothetical protein
MSYQLAHLQRILQLTTSVALQEAKEILCRKAGEPGINLGRSDDQSEEC